MPKNKKPSPLLIDLETTSVNAQFAFEKTYKKDFENIISEIKKFIPNWQDHEEILTELNLLIQAALKTGIKAGFTGRLNLVEHNYLIEVEHLKFLN